MRVDEFNSYIELYHELGKTTIFEKDFPLSHSEEVLDNIGCLNRSKRNILILERLRILDGDPKRLEKMKDFQLVTDFIFDKEEKVNQILRDGESGISI
jgi:hypothetical protein